MRRGTEISDDPADGWDDVVLIFRGDEDPGTYHVVTRAKDAASFKRGDCIAMCGFEARASTLRRKRPLDRHDEQICRDCLWHLGAE
jgi:hypothetical protein